eukprot:1070172-Rhodomonas_salina.1
MSPARVWPYGPAPQYQPPRISAPRTAPRVSQYRTTRISVPHLAYGPDLAHLGGRAWSWSRTARAAAEPQPKSMAFLRACRTQ